MPLYMDRHEGVANLTPQDIAEAHMKDIEVQGKYGVRYITYWFNEGEDTGFCLVDAPSKERAEAVHRESHGLVGIDIIEVNQRVVEEFLGNIAETPAAIDPSTTVLQSGLRTILFTDMESSTAITQRLGDAGAMEIIRRHDTVIRDALKAHSGREVKHTGDGIMASFGSATGALNCAIAVQRAFAARNEQNPDTPIRVRIGLTAGEPVLENQDLFGASVQLAGRICDCAKPSEILVANVLRELCIGKGFLFADSGEVELRGFEDPVRLYEVRWREEAD